MPIGWLEAVGIGYWAVTTGGGVGAGVGVPLVIGVPLPHAARKPTAKKTKRRRAIGSLLIGTAFGFPPTGS